jgi:hypothetical protein
LNDFAQNYSALQVLLLRLPRFGLLDRNNFRLARYSQANRQFCWIFHFLFPLFTVCHPWDGNADWSYSLNRR